MADFSQFSNTNLATPPALGQPMPSTNTAPGHYTPQPLSQTDTSSFTPDQLSKFNAASAPSVISSNATPPITQIQNPVNPPSGTGSAPPQTNATAPTLADQFNTSLSSTLQAQQQQLQDALAKQTQNYQQQIDALKQQNADAQNMESLGLSNQSSLTAQETQQKQDALQQEQQQFQQNYDARQKLTDQLQTLLTQGQSVIEGLKNTSGLSSIMNARISQTMADVQGQAGVISTALAAYDTQIGLAQKQLDTATTSITSIYSDQISYWKNVVDFYDTQTKNNDTAITQLSNDQKTFIDAQIKNAQDAIANTQATAKTIMDAMLDPTKALAYAKAGVSLTDTPAQINQKLAAQAQADQNVWSAPKLLGGDYIQTNKLTGETRTVVSNIPTGPAAGNYSFTPTNKTSLVGAGETSASIKKLESDIGQYGAQYVLDNGQGLSSATQTIIENEFGITKTPAPGTSKGLFGLGILGF